MNKAQQLIRDFIKAEQGKPTAVKVERRRETARHRVSLSELRPVEFSGLACDPNKGKLRW